MSNETFLISCGKQADSEHNNDLLGYCTSSECGWTEHEDTRLKSERRKLCETTTNNGNPC